MSNTPQLSRRAFLRSTMIALGGSLLAACQATGPVPPTQPTQPPAQPVATTAPAAPASAGNTVKIGAVVPVTGRYAALGEQVKNGYELAFEDLNKTSKIQLEMKLLDDESDPTKTVQRLESLTSSDQVLAYLGGAGSDLHAAAAAIGDKNRTPYLGIGFALYQVHQRGLKYLFSPFPKSPQLSKAIFDLLETLSPKPTKVAIFAEKTDWGAELGSIWKQDAGSRGYEVVSSDEYSPGAKDFSSMLQKAKGANAEVALALPSPPDGLAIAKQMKELDFAPNVAEFIRASDGLSWAQNLGKDGDFFMNAPGWSPQLKYPGVAELRDRHQATYNKPAEALVGAAYAAVQVLFDAVNRVGKPDRDALRDALAATDLQTVAGPVKFNSDGTGQVVTVMNQWVDSKQVLVWPKDQAAAPLAYPAKPWSER